MSNDLQKHIDALAAEVERLKHDRNNLLNALLRIEEGDYEHGEQIQIASEAINVHEKFRKAAIKTPQDRDE